MKVIFTLPALADLDALLDYFAAHSPRNASRARARVKTYVDLLASHPSIGRRTSDPAIRRLVLAPYPWLLFYEVGANAITVHAIRHGARDPSTMPGAGRT